MSLPQSKTEWANRFTVLLVHTTSPRVGLGQSWAQQVWNHTCQQDRGYQWGKGGSETTLSSDSRVATREHLTIPVQFLLWGCWRWIFVNLVYLLYIGFVYGLQLTRHYRHINDVTSSLFECGIWSMLFTQDLGTKRSTSGKVQWALYERIMKPGTSQHSRWTWLQTTQGPQREGTKLQGPKQKMLKLARQGALSKPWRRWRQGSTCRRGKSTIDRDMSGSEMGPNRAEMGLGRLAQSSRPGLFRARFATPFDLGVSL
jgi:hypothetical protein